MMSSANRVVSQFGLTRLNTMSALWHTVLMAKRPRDPNQLAKLIVDIAIGEVEDVTSESKRHPSKRRMGGLKGGKVRAKSLTKKERRAIAHAAARARWKRKN